MAINQEAVSDAARALAFADDLRATYAQIKTMQAKINRYAAGVAAIQAGTVDARELRFVQLVSILVTAEDITRIGALLPMINDWCEILEANYQDLIS